MKLTPGQKKIAVYVLVGVAAFFVIRGAIKYHDMKAEAAMVPYLREVLDKAEAARKEAVKKAAAIQDAAKSDILKRDKRIKELEDIAVSLGGHSNAIGAELADLKDKYKLLTDCPAQKANLLAQNIKWEERFSLAQRELITERAKTAEWIGKATDWRKMYEAEKAVSGACGTSLEAALNSNHALTASVRSLKLKVAARNVVIVAVVGVAAYLLVKK